uniref:ER membrane protein complex subunit 6 n=1 Tax=Psilocybe cubensis TaxID=181762 RepID=A0A8H7Y0E7_PSICU
MTTQPDPTTQHLYTPNILSNTSLTSTKFLTACFSGACAGILGLENLSGFLLFAASMLGMAGAVGAVKCKGRPGRYFRGGIWEVVSPGQDNAFTFVLVWTLFYGIVHVYD